MNTDNKATSAGVEWALPEGYTAAETLDLQKDKKLALLVNGIALVIMLALFPIGLRLAPTMAREGKLVFTLSSFLSLWGVQLGLIAVYMVLHELAHGVFIKRYSGKKAKYGFSGLYAFAGSDAYFYKKPYIVVALAPVVLFGILFAILLPLVPAALFWRVYLLQMVNLSGAAGDLYMTWLMRRYPASALTHDVGTAMTIYTKR